MVIAMKEGDAEGLATSGLTVEELYRIAAENANYGFAHRGFVLKISPEFTIEEVGKQINRGEFGFQYFNDPMYWVAFKKEFHILLCSKDKKYQKLRSNLAKSNEKGLLAVVWEISDAIAGSLGVVAGELVPICAICLIAVLKLGKETFCHAKTLDVRVGPE
jgi:hypothetical protein